MATATGEWRLASTPRSAVARFAMFALLAVVAGCSGDDDALPTEPPVQPRDTTTTIVATVAPTTTASTFAIPSTQPTSTVARPTAPLPTGSPTASATAASSTDAPTTASTSIEQAALAAVDGAYAVWRECIRNLPLCDTSRFGEFLIDPQLSDDQALIAEWKAASYEADDVDRYSYEVIEVRLDAFVPFVLVCQVDGSSLVQRPPGQSETVISDRYTEKIREVQLTSTGSGWRVHGFATREESDQVGELCG